MLCHSCGQDNRLQARFCDTCGKRLRPAHLEAGERRQVTILFCDLVGSTALAEQMDPEELRALVRAFHTVCDGRVRAHGGSVAQYLGDGVLACFGHPKANENDSQSAVRAALEIVASAQVHAQVRAGIHTGLVVTGLVGGADRPDGSGVFGIVPNVAARIQALADPGTVLISEATHTLVRGFFDCDSLGTHPIKGVSTSVSLYRVRGASAARSRVDAALGTRLTPLVGRQRELTELLSCWREAAAGFGRVVQVRGDPGIGKSRLVWELTSSVIAAGAAILEARCSPHAASSPLRPVIELLEREWGVRAADPPEARFAAASMALADADGDEVVLLASLLEIPLPQGVDPLALSPQTRKRRTFEAIVARVRAIASRRPLLLVFEDLHWVDPSTSELVELLIEALQSERILLVLTFRPEVEPVPAGAFGRLFDLQRLTGTETEQLIEEIAGVGVLPGALVRAVGERADGVPLFAEELTRAVLDRGSRVEAGGTEIPTTLQESLMARLDRLAPVRELVQLAATLGRSFPRAHLRAVSTLDDADFAHELDRLVTGEILERAGDDPDAVYRFKHVLIQEAAHESLLRSRRCELHERVARTLQDRFPHLASMQPELLAHHYAGARRFEEAISWCHRAGVRAVERSAHLEARSQLEYGLTLIEQLPEGPDRDARECALRNTLGVALLSSLGYAAPEVEQTYERARALCVGEARDRDLFASLWGLGTFQQARARLTAALELAHERLALARRLDDEGLLLQAHESIGTVSFWRGELAEAERHLQVCMERYDADRFGGLALHYGQDVGVVARAYGGVLAWFRGRPDTGVQLCDDAISLARARRHPYSLGLALDFAAALHALRGESERACALADEAIALAREQQFPFWLGFGLIMRGWSLALRGEHAAGLEQLQEGMSAYQGTGAELGGRFCLAILADVQRRAGRITDALGAIEVALPGLVGDEERFWDSEIERMRGELMLLRDAASEAAAEACFERALACSRAQEARALELRAMTSLAALRRRQGSGEQAGALLKPLLASFVEGNGTADVRAAVSIADASS